MSKYAAHRADLAWLVRVLWTGSTAARWAEKAGRRYGR